MVRANVSTRKSILRRIARFVTICVVLTALPSVAVIWVTRVESGPPDMNAPLTGILLRGSTVVAASANGLFEASTLNHQWKRLPMQRFAPRGGRLTGRPDQPVAYYYARGPKQSHGLRDGLWRTEDGGNTWSTVLGGLIADVYVSPKGTLYALQGERVGPSRIAMSPNSGRTWDDITHGLSRGVFGLCADPNNPEQVACLQEGIRVCVVTAPDKRYQWNGRTPEWAIRGKSDLTSPSPARLYTTQAAGYMLNATLANYFDYRFGEQTELIAFDIVADRPEYTFSRDEPKVIPVELRFLPPQYGPISLPDANDPRQFWYLDVLDPHGKLRAPPEREAIVTRIGPATNEAISTKTATAAPPPSRGDRHSAGFRIVRVDSAHPYRRSIDLSAFGSFTVPGKYRVQLGYRNEGVAGSSQEEWLGSFDGQTITVTVTR